MTEALSSPGSSLTRREALRRVGSGAVGLSVLFGVKSARGATRVDWKTPSGAEIWQLTRESYSQANIYLEYSYCSPDSKYFVYQRENKSPTDGNNPTEYMVMELATWQSHRLDEGTGRPGLAITRTGVFHYMKHDASDGRLYLMRANLSEGKPEKIHLMKRKPWTIGTASEDGRYYLCGTLLEGVVEDRKQVFGPLLINLATGEERVIDQGTDIFNLHPQFDPRSARRVLVQHNRGGHADPGGVYRRSTGPQGATLFLYEVPSGRRIPLPIGTPHTPPITGHESWIGTTGRILVSAGGRLFTVGETDATREIVCPGFNFNHVHASHDGRVFLCDDWKPPYKQLLGSIQTGKAKVLFEAYDTPRQMTKAAHTHAYLTPDLRWAIFNSDRTGPILLYAARVPDGLVDSLLASETPA